MTYGETRNRTTLETSQTVGFNVSFRTIGDFGSNSSGFASHRRAAARLGLGEAIVSPHRSRKQPKMPDLPRTPWKKEMKR